MKKIIILSILFIFSIAIAAEFDNSFPPNSAFGLIIAPTNKCGGVYIHTNIILTAKECLQDKSGQTYQPQSVIFSAAYQDKFSMFKVNLDAIIFSRLEEKNIQPEKQMAYALLIVSKAYKNNAGSIELYNINLKNNSNVDKISFSNDSFEKTKCKVTIAENKNTSKLVCPNKNKAGDIIMVNNKIAGVVINNKNDVINSSFISQNPYLKKVYSESKE